MNLLRKRILWVVGLFPVVFFGFITAKYSVNTPWFDDFDPFPDFLRKWILSEGLSQKVELLFQPNNEHRMVFGKGLAALYYLLTSELNFTFLHIAGILFTFGTLLIVWKAFQTAKIPLYLFIPVPFFLFQLQYHLISLWAICGLQHQPVVFFVCLSMYLLARKQNNKYLLLAILTGFCANFAMSNGIFVWIGGAAILLFQTRYRALVFWCLCGVTAIGLYFNGMSAQGNESSIDFFLANPHLSFLGFFAFLGGLFDFTPERAIEVRTALPILMAFLIMVWILLWLGGIFTQWLKTSFNLSPPVTQYLSRYQIQSERHILGYFSLGVLLFILSNAAVIALLRPRFGFFVMVVSNYKIYPALFMVISYLAFLASFQGKRLQNGFYLGLSTSVLIWALTLIHYLPAIAERRDYLLINAYNQQHHGFGLGHEPGSKAAAYVDTLMHFMTDRQIYHYPTELDPLIQEIKQVQAPLPGNFDFNVIKQESQLLITAPSIPIFSGYRQGSFAFIRTAGVVYLFKLNQNQYTGRNLFITYDKGLGTTIPFSAIPTGTHPWGVYLNGQSNSLIGLVSTITFP
jgi:hypothetical protein